MQWATEHALCKTLHLDNTFDSGGVDELLKKKQIGFWVRTSEP